jgi:hypothetical protein
VTRSTVESIRKIDVNALHRKGCFADSRREFPITWSIDGRTTDVVIASSDRWNMELKYHSDNRNEPVRVTIPITWTECHLGGSRPWFKCNCGRRVGTLFEFHQFYVCRTCHGLNYEAQQFSRKRRKRTIFPGFRIREHLGGRPNLLDPFPTKPKGQHRRTYNRLKERAEAAERDFTAARDQLKAVVPLLKTLRRDQLVDLLAEVQSMRQITLRLSSRERMFVHIERPSRRGPVRQPETRPMLHGDLVSSRQLKAARVLAGLTQAKLATEAGYNPDACRYWESRGDG